MGNRLKLIIAGGRGYQFTDADRKRLNDLAAENEIAEVVSGGARGADRCGEMWAQHGGIPVRLFRADWGQYGAKAGPIRNGQMAEYADALVAFPGGSGTANMVAQATQRGLRVWDWR